jgi:regulator of protease activity HflC (stomatin/prohibitin superfamily)
VWVLLPTTFPATLVGVSCYFLLFAYKLIPPATLGVRQFLGPKKMFMECRVFAPPKLSSLVLIPGDRMIEFTQKMGKSDFEAQVQSGIYGNVPEKPLEVNIHAAIVFGIDIRQCPDTVVRMYYEDFRHNNTEVALKDVAGRVLPLLFSAADSVIQRHTIADLFKNVQTVNNALVTDLQGEMFKSGIDLKQFLIEDVEDIKGKDAIVKSIRDAATQEAASIAAIAIAQATSKQTIETAKAEKDGKIEAANAKKEYREKEIETEQAVALRNLAMQLEVATKATTVKEQIVKVREQEALAKVAELKARLTVLQGGDAQRAALLSVLEKAGPENLVAVLKDLATNAGIKMDHGTLVSLGGQLRDAQGFPAILDTIIDGIQKMTPPKTP